MTGAGEALEGALGLIGGGFIFLLFSSALGSNVWVDFELWGVIYIVAGLFLAVTIVAVLIGGLWGR